MTGFGSAERGGFRVEVRSLNHRFLEVYTKLPPALGRHEIAIREAIRKRYARGKFDVFVSVTGAEGIKLGLHSAIAREIHSVLKKLKEECGIPGEITLEHILHWRDLFVEEEVSYDEIPLFEALEKALEELTQMREREGKALAADISSRAEAIEGLSGEVAALRLTVAETQKVKFREKLRELLEGSPFDEAAVLQEASSVAEKSDISEELSRVESHVAQIRKILGAADTIGRKLDFLLQELHREANTIASKAGDGGVLHNVIEMKAQIERAREQAQNIQ